VGAVHDRTEGNPFFVTELLRLLQSEGTLQADDAMTAARRAIPLGYGRCCGAGWPGCPSRPTRSC
jgi:hypothetical protein